MKTFSLSAKLFYKSNFLLISYVLFLVGIILNFIRVFQSLSSYNQTAFDFLSETVGMSIFCTAFFMFFSYEFFSKTKSSNIEECLTSVKGGRFKLLLGQIAVVALLILAVTVCSVLCNLVYPHTDIRNGDYVLHMLYSIFVYLFAVPFTGSLMGIGLSFTFKRLPGYLIMVVFLLLSSPLSGMISHLVSSSTLSKVDIAPCFDIFNIYPLNLDFASLYSFGISLLPYKLATIFFWLLAAVALVLWKLSKPVNRIMRITSLGCAVACVANFLVVFAPVSKVDMSTRVNGTLYSDKAYYRALYDGKYPKEQAAEFEVLQYDLQLTVKNKLYAEAKLKIDNPNLKTYPFTLYHNFKIKNITDQNGTFLSFKQENDRVEVYSSGQPLTTLHFTYSGYNTRFYSNTQGVFLPGYFAYYPIAGYRNVFSSDYQAYAKTLLAKDTDFTLTVNTKKQVFTNLSQSSNGTYTGKTNGLTVMSGFLDSKTVQGIEVVYHPFNTGEYNETRLQKDIDKFLKVENTDSIKKILVAPNVNQTYDSTVIFSDYVITEQVMALDTNYFYASMHSFKVKLYFYQKMYLEDREEFNRSVESEKNYPPQLDKICTLLLEKITLLGEDTVISQTNEYLFNGGDTRTIVEFLNQLDKAA